MSISRRTTRHWLLIALLLGGFALRAYNLGEQELRGDEAFSWLFANRPLLDIVPVLIEEADPHPPLHYLQVGAWLHLTGDSEYALRYVSALAGLLLLPAMWQLGRWVRGERLGVLLVGLTAVSPSLIWLSQDLRNQYTFALLFTTLATVILTRHTTKWSMDNSPWSMANGFAFVLPYGVLAALAMYSHYYAIFALLAHGAYLLFVPEHRRFLPAWIVSGLLALVLFLPWVWVILFRLAGKQLTDPSTPKLAVFLTQIGVELSLGRGVTSAWWARWLFLALAGVAGLGGWMLLTRAKTSKREAHSPFTIHYSPFTIPQGAGLLFISWLLLTAVGIFLILFRRSTFNAFYITVAAPAWLMLVGVGLTFLWQRANWGRLLAGVVLGSWLLSTAVSLNQQYFDPTVSKTWGYRPMTAHLSREAQPNDLFVAHFPDPSFDYYLRHLDMPRTIAPRRPGQTADETRAYLAELTEEYDRLWFVPAHRSGWDPEDVAYNWLEFETLREQMATYDRLDLIAYRPPRTLPQVAHPVGRTLRDEIGLRHAFVTVNGAPIELDESPLQLAPGDMVRVTLEWEALGNVDTSYTAFVHLVGADGQMVAQHDGVPVNGNRPTNYWQAGQTFLDTHELSVPPETAVDSGVLFIGLYNTASLERQPFNDGVDSWPLTAVSLAHTP